MRARAPAMLPLSPASTPGPTFAAADEVDERAALALELALALALALLADEAEAEEDLDEAEDAEEAALEEAEDALELEEPVAAALEPVPLAEATTAVNRISQSTCHTEHMGINVETYNQLGRFARL